MASSRVNPVPRITIDGTVLNTTGFAAWQTRPPTATATPVVIEPLVIDWGRDNETAQVKPATATVRLWDPHGARVQRWLKTSPVVGKSAALEWEDSASGTKFRMFTGFVTGMSVKPWRMPRKNQDGNTNPGFLITLQLTSKDGALGNIVHGPGTLANGDTLIQRANLIKNGAEPTGIDAFLFEPQTTGWTCSSKDTKDTTLRNWVDELYLAIGNWWTYVAHENKVRGVRRFANPQPRYFKRYQSGPNGETRHHIVPGAVNYDSVTYLPVGLSGAECTVASTELVAEQSSAVNSMSIAFKDEGDQDQTLGYEVREAGEPRVTYSGSSWLNQQGIGQQVVNDLWFLLTTSMALPRHPIIRFDTSIGGGFLNLEQAKTLTQCAELFNEVYLSGSRWAGVLGANPQFRIGGGRITYANKNWTVDVNLKWCGNHGRGTPTKFSDVAPGITLGSIEPGVTFNDFTGITNPGTIYGGD